MENSPVYAPTDINRVVQSSLLRYHALVALQKSLSTAKRAVADGASKDILKQMKNGLTDKSLPVQRAAANVRSVLRLLLSHIERKSGHHSDVFAGRCEPPFR
jgi:hypothetical protein